MEGAPQYLAARERKLRAAFLGRGRSKGCISRRNCSHSDHEYRRGQATSTRQDGFLRERVAEVPRDRHLPPTDQGERDVNG
jgi:hypothetical protein